MPRRAATLGDSITELEKQLIHNGRGKLYITWVMNQSKKYMAQIYLEEIKLDNTSTGPKRSDQLEDELRR